MYWQRRLAPAEGPPPRPRLANPNTDPNPCPNPYPNPNPHPHPSPDPNANANPNPNQGGKAGTSGATPAPASSIVEKLSELTALRDAGALDEDEFKAAKRGCLQRRH